MSDKLTQKPSRVSSTFLNFPFEDDLDADIAILGIPFGMPYSPDAMANDQSLAPDALRQTSTDVDISYNPQPLRFRSGWALAGRARHKGCRLRECDSRYG